MQSEDLQQPGICGVAVTVGFAGLRSGVSADAYVHDPDELRKGLGRGISPPDSHLDSLLDRAAFKRAAAVARQGTHANGLASPTLFLDVLSLCILHPFVRERRIHEDTLHVFLSSSSMPPIDRLVSSSRTVCESWLRCPEFPQTNVAQWRIQEEEDIQSSRSKIQSTIGREWRLRHNETKFPSHQWNRGFLELSRDRPRSDHDVWYARTRRCKIETATRSRGSINIIVDILKLNVLPRFVVIEERRHGDAQGRERDTRSFASTHLYRAHMHRNWRTRYIQGDHNPSLVDS